MSKKPDTDIPAGEITNKTLLLHQKKMNTEMREAIVAEIAEMLKTHSEEIRSHVTTQQTSLQSILSGQILALQSQSSGSTAKGGGRRGATSNQETLTPITVLTKMLSEPGYYEGFWDMLMTNEAIQKSVTKEDGDDARAKMAGRIYNLLGKDGIAVTDSEGNEVVLNRNWLKEIVAEKKKQLSEETAAAAADETADDADSVVADADEEVPAKPAAKKPAAKKPAAKPAAKTAAAEDAPAKKPAAKAGTAAKPAAKAGTAAKPAAKAGTAAKPGAAAKK